MGTGLSTGIGTVIGTGEGMSVTGAPGKAFSP